MGKSLSASYLRVQAERCQRLSRMCIDLGTARDLRLMADEYLAEAALMEKADRRDGLSGCDVMADSKDGMTRQDNILKHPARGSSHPQ